MPEQDNGNLQRGGDMSDAMKNAGAFSPAPPPPEVKVRTFSSDLESMARSGGGLPQFKRVPVSQAMIDGKESGLPKAISKILMPVVLAVILGIIIYFIYVVFSKNNNAGQNPLGGARQVNVPSLQPIQTQQSAPVSTFVHSSLFRKPADQIISLVIPQETSNASDLKTFSQRMNLVLSSAKQDSSMVEIKTQSTDGRYLSAYEVWSSANSDALAKDFLEANFNPDATLFVYKDKSGFRLGYVLALKPSKNWLFLKNDVAQIEQSPKIENFFLSPPGAPSAKGFEDAIINNQPVRRLSFSSGGEFLYGWSNGNLIVSTSAGGFKEAVAKL